MSRALFFGAMALPAVAVSPIVLLHYGMGLSWLASTIVYVAIVAGLFTGGGA